MAGIILGTIYVASQVMSVMEQKKANYQRRVAAQKEYDAAQKRADIQNVRSTRENIRAAKIAQAQMQNTAAQTGGMGGSALAGGMSSISSQVSSNINYTSQIAQQNTAIASAQLEGASVTSNAEVWGAIGNIAGTIFQGTGGFKKMMS
jgi:multidrug efflux pump subunit AcrA (membrane-fusion protein)